jgi:hypothetical protein
VKLKQIQIDDLKREIDYTLSSRIEERIQKEKQTWDQEQNYLIRRELGKLNEEKNKEINKIQGELLEEREKNFKLHERNMQLEKVWPIILLKNVFLSLLDIERKSFSFGFKKDMDELNQEIKITNKEKMNSLNKMKESFHMETDKFKEEILNVSSKKMFCKISMSDAKTC